MAPRREILGVIIYYFVDAYHLPEKSMSSMGQKNEDLKDEIENLNEVLTSKKLEINALKGELAHLESLSKGRCRSSVETDSGLGEVHEAKCHGHYASWTLWILCKNFVY